MIGPSVSYRIARCQQRDQKVFTLQTLPLVNYLKCVNKAFYYLHKGDFHNGSKGYF
jgi:hypothetical protein